MNELKMQDIFDINTAIEQLKNAVKANYNFEVDSNTLKTSVYIHTNNTPFSLSLQNRYVKLNEDFKKLMNDMIEELIQDRDNMMLRLLSVNQQNNQENDDTDNKDEEA